MNLNWSYSPETPNLGQIRQFLVPCDLEIWRMTLKNNRAPLLSNIKLYVSFHHHMWIQTGVTVRKRLSWVVTSVTLTFDLRPWSFAWTLPSKVQKRSIRVDIGDMLSRVTLKFDGWPWKTIEHLFYATSSFVQHFVAIGEFKLELQSGNAQSGSNSKIFRAVRPWNLTNDLAKQQGTSSMLLQALCIILYPLVN